MALWHLPTFLIAAALWSVVLSDDKRFAAMFAIFAALSLGIA